MSAGGARAFAKHVSLPYGDQHFWCGNLSVAWLVTRQDLKKKKERRKKRRRKKWGGGGGGGGGRLRLWY